LLFFDADAMFADARFHERPPSSPPHHARNPVSAVAMQSSSCRLLNPWDACWRRRRETNESHHRFATAIRAIDLSLKKKDVDVAQKYAEKK